MNGLLSIDRKHKKEKVALAICLNNMRSTVKAVVKACEGVQQEREGI